MNKDRDMRSLASSATSVVSQRRNKGFDTDALIGASKSLSATSTRGMICQLSGFFVKWAIVVVLTAVGLIVQAQTTPPDLYHYKFSGANFCANGPIGYPTYCYPFRNTPQELCADWQKLSTEDTAAQRLLPARVVTYVAGDPGYCHPSDDYRTGNGYIAKLTRIIEQNDGDKPVPGGCDFCAGNPIYPMTGAKVERLALGFGVSGEQLVLTYNSRTKVAVSATPATPAVPRIKAFGDLWYSSFHRTVFVATSLLKAQVLRGDGTVYSFSGDGSGGFTATADISHKLQAVTGGYLFTDLAARVMELYDASGKLLRISRADGPVLNFFYAGNMLTSVQGSDGRFVRFAYGANGLISQVVDSGGAAVSIAYDGNGNLQSTTWPDGHVAQFAYEDASFPWALTGKIDENNSRFATFVYDSGGRAVSTEHAGGVHNFSVTYGTPPYRAVNETYDAPTDTVSRTYTWVLPTNTTVTQPNGSTVAVQAVNVMGVPGLSSVSQQAGSGSASASRAIAYTSSGRVASRDDFDGPRTCYDYDSTNREKVRVEGLATSVTCSAVIGTGATLPAGSRRVDTTWHPDWNLETRVVQPLRKTTVIYHGQPDPFNGNAVASCTSAQSLPAGKPLPVVCKRVEQALLGNGSVDSSVPGKISSFLYDSSGRVLSSVNPRGQSTTMAYYSSGASADPVYDKVTLLLKGNGANGSTAVVDDSPKGVTLTAAGGSINAAQSKYGGGSLAFTGAGYVSTPDSDDWYFGDADFTIDAWIYVSSSTSAYSHIVGQRSGTSTGWTLGVEKSGNRIYFWQNATFVAGSSGNYAGKFDSWHHVALVRSGNLLRIFIDGALVDTATAVTVNNNTSPLYVGGNVPLGDYLVGFVDDLRITKGVARYASTFAPPTSEAPGPTLPDSSHVAGDLYTVTNSAGHVTTYNAYDAAGRVRRMTDAKGVATEITYTPRGFVHSVAVTPPGGPARTTTYTHDGVGMLIAVSQPDGTGVSYSYDAAHRLIGAMDTRGNSVSYTLDGAGNRIGEQLRDPSSVLRRDIVRNFDALNRLQQVVGAVR